jgi:hypothetical protein
LSGFLVRSLFSLFISRRLVSLFADLSQSSLLLTARPIYMRKVKSVQCSIVSKRNIVLIKLRKHVHRWPC